MTTIRRTLLAASLLAILAAQPAAAHHSGAMFDHTKLVRLTGVVKLFNWVNPHSNIVVVAEGAEQTWNIETSSPGILTRAGWNKHSLSPGDRVEMSIAPLQGGGPAGLLMDVKNLTTGVSLGRGS